MSTISITPHAARKYARRFRKRVIRAESYAEMCSTLQESSTIAAAKICLQYITQQTEPIHPVQFLTAWKVKLFKWGNFRYSQYKLRLAACKLTDHFMCIVDLIINRMENEISKDEFICDCKVYQHAFTTWIKSPQGVLAASLTRAIITVQGALLFQGTQDEAKKLVLHAQLHSLVTQLTSMN